MKTLIKVLAGITLATLLVFPLGGVFAECRGGAPDGIRDGGEQCDDGPSGSATCNTSCITTSASTGGAGSGSAAGNTIGGKDPSELPDWTSDEVMSLVGKIVNWIFTFLMLFVVIMVIVAGFTFVTGGGNPDNVTKARNMLMYALVGFAVGMLAKGIIALVEAFLNKSAGPNPFFS